MMCSVNCHGNVKSLHTTKYGRPSNLELGLKHAVACVCVQVIIMAIQEAMMLLSRVSFVFGMWWCIYY